MSYNSNSLDFHSTAPDTARELAEFPFVNQQQAIYQLNHQANDILQVTDRWGMVPQPGPTTASPMNLLGFSKCRCKPSFESSLTGESSDSVAGSTTYSRRLDGYAQPSFTDPCWPAMSQPPHPGHAGFSGWGTFPASRAMEPGSPTVISTPSSGENLLCNPEEQDAHRSRTAPLHHWGENQSGPLVSTFDQVNTGPGSLSISLLTPSLSKSRT